MLCHCVGGNYLIDKEYCLYFRNGVRLNTNYESAKTYWMLNKNKKDKEKFLHPTIKPLGIIKTLVKNSSSEGDVVLDCFSRKWDNLCSSKRIKQKIYWNRNK